MFNGVSSVFIFSESFLQILRVHRAFPLLQIVNILQPALYKKLVFFNGTLSLYRMGGKHVETVQNITEGSSVTNLAGQYRYTVCRA